MNPENTADTGEGALLWASGSQLGVGQPAVHRCQTGFGAIADKCEDECGFHQGGRKKRRICHEVGPEKGLVGVERQIFGSQAHQHGSQKGKTDTNRTDKHVFPGRFE